MADTSFIKSEVEQYVRDRLSERFEGVKFEKHPVPVKLSSGCHHKFDAVSKGGGIVAAILSNRSKTRTGKENTGAVRKALLDVALLNLVEGDVIKLMVFTDAGLRDLISKRAKKLGTQQIEMTFCELRPDLNERLTSNLEKARGRLVQLDNS